MNRSEAWARFAASALTNEAELDIAAAGHVADEMLQQFDARFRQSAGGPDLEDSAAARSGRDPLTRAEDYISDAFDRYIADPADSDYQRGYIAALITVADELNTNIPDEVREQL